MVQYKLSLLPVMLIGTFACSADRSLVGIENSHIENPNAGSGAGAGSVGSSGSPGAIGSGVVGGGEITAPQGIFVPTGSMTVPRQYHTATLLLNGKVLVAGGYDGSFRVFASAELYDPSTGTFTATGSTSAARAWYTATLLPNGKVLIAGAAAGHASAELYDPSAGRFTTTGNMVEARMLHTATLLGNGKVLIAGGGADSPPDAQGIISGKATASAELYDPNAGTFAATDTMLTVFGSHNSHTATLLRDGKVLVAGQPQSSGGPVGPSAELYDPSTGTFAATGSVTVQRSVNTATLLPGGMVLIAGGWGYAGGLADAELYDPDAGTFAAAGSMSVARAYHTATLLPNGMVLIAGGDTFGTAELYE